MDVTTTDFQQQLNELLSQAFADLQLSNDEKQALKHAFHEIRNDNSKLSFARNLAFNLVNQHCQQQTTFDSQAFKWLEQVIKTLDSVRIDGKSRQEYAYFSPSDDCKNAIMRLIQQCQQQMQVCVFTISDDDLAQALLTAHRRGVTVQIITDNEKAFDDGSDVNYLLAQGVPIRVDSSPYHMHHKFAIFDQRILVNGSFNWTRSASKYNNENITVQYHSELITQFSSVFSSLWRQFG